MATIVVEAGERSGTRIQARKAIAHGRPVILTDTVIQHTAWGRDLVGQPGVHVVTGIDDLSSTIDELLNSGTAAEEALHQLMALAAQ